MANKLIIVIPAYNEQDNIKDVINDWYPVVEKYGDDSQLVIIDDGSKDNTFSIMEEEAKTRPKFKPITKPNAGHGATVLYGYNYALENGADYIFQTDSDGQTLPGEFDQFWKEKENHDMVIGWRNSREDGFSRVFVTKTLKLVIRLCFKVKVTDANTPFRIIRASALKEQIGEIPKDFNLSNVLLTVLLTKRGYKIKYIPITFRPRQGGINSINLPRIFGIGKQAVKDFRRINRILKDKDENEENK